MVEQIETVYTLFDSVDEMLAPDALSGLLARRVTRVSRRPMNGHSGLAGGQLDYVDTDHGRFVLKRMSFEVDWIMFASQDTQCRSVKLWQFGQLDRLRPHLEHSIIACAQHQDGWAILMDDLTGKVFAWDKPVPLGLVLVFLDRLARLHATFWNDPILKDARLGLSNPTNLLESLRMAQKHPGDQRGVIPDWIRGGWEVMEQLLDRDVFQQISDLLENPLPITQALSRYPSTLLHVDYRSENLAHLEPDRPVVLDWQGAACALMTIDLAWFITWVCRDRMSQEQAASYYRLRLETYLNIAFEDKDWQAMLELGILVDALRSTFFLAYFSKYSDDPDNRAHDRAVVKQREQQVCTALRWL